MDLATAALRDLSQEPGIALGTAPVLLIIRNLGYAFRKYLIGIDYGGRKRRITILVLEEGQSELLCYFALYLDIIRAATDPIMTNARPSAGPDPTRESTPAVSISLHIPSPSESPGASLASEGSVPQSSSS